METHWDPDTTPERDERGDDDRETREHRAALLGFVAHEVRNPLSTALWTAELLARMSAEERGGARGEKLTAMSLRALARVRQTIEDHFLVERLDVGGLPVRNEEVDVGEVARAAAAKVAGAKVEVAIEGALVARVDPSLLERALESLVAVASTGSAAVRVTGTREQGSAVLRVDGAPPAPDAMEDPRKGSPSDQRGRALAASVARRVARALRGKLDVDARGWVLTLPGAEAYTPAPR